MKNRVKPITLTLDNGKKYVLDFDRDSAIYAEEHGFSVTDGEKCPLSSAYKLFYFAMLKNHPDVTYEFAKDFLDKQFGGVAKLPEGFIARLVELYSATFGSIYDEEERKNPRLTVDM